MKESFESNHVPLKDIYTERGEDILKNQPLFETIEVLRKTPMYSDNESLSQYYELCEVIDFTRMADILHLITHYGVVSQSELESVSDQKEAGKLLIRKNQSDAYLSKYGLSSFNDGLDQAYPDPIGLRDKSKWYSVASSLLTNSFKSAKVRINKLSNKLYFVNVKGERDYIDSFSLHTFSSFLSIVLHTSSIYKFQIDWTDDLLKRYVASMLESDEFSTDSITNDIIQFDDCYVEDGKFEEGKYPYIPRFYINFKVLDVVKSGKVSKTVEEINDFLLHLADYDTDTVKVFLSRMSTFLMNNDRLKTNFAATINILYGASGANGKSLFLSILKKIFDSEDVLHAGLRDFNNKNYLLPEMCQSLLIVDEDAADLQLDSAATSAIKQFTHGQSMRVRSIYEKTRTFRPRAMVVACTNHMPTAVDKSDGFNRRFSIFTQTSKLVNRNHNRSEEWFKAIRSDEASKYLLDLLILAHLENMERGRLLENSARMKEINEDFVQKNDSAVMYVRSVGLKEIVGKPVKIVRENYEKWCETNGVSALKNKFNTTLESKFSLKAKNVSPMKLALDKSDLLASGFSDNVSVVRAWTHLDNDVNQKYLDLFNDTAEDLYQIDTSSNMKDIAKEIVESLEKTDQIENYSEDFVKRKISILMNEDQPDRADKITDLVLKKLRKSYETEICLAKDLSKSDRDKYISIGKNNKSLASALKDPRRQVLIFREKKDSNKERN